jgi:hypothetical protein
MGQAKIKQRAQFSPGLIETWEANDCVDFAVALARITRWLLHVDWWSTSTEHQEGIFIGELRPMRVYVADNWDLIFDVRGVKSLVDYNERIMRPLAIKMQTGSGGIYTRFYGEGDLAALPLRVQPDEANIERASQAITKNAHFLASIPKRTPPYLPAHNAAKFTYGRCAVYAEAMQELTGLRPVALLARRISPLFEGTKRSTEGYVHSVVVHPDGMAEDSWGKASLQDIAERFGIIEFAISGDVHRSVVSSIRSNSDDRYMAALQEARELIRLHRM